MKVLFLTKYGIRGASSRLRTYQYLPFYKQSGLSVKVSPFFSELYVKQLYDRKSRGLWLSFQSFFKRLMVLFTVWRYDKVVIEKELFPYFPAFFEVVLSSLGVKYIVDYDDAIWHNYDESPRKWLRLLLGNKIDHVMRNASVVICGNEYIYEKAKNAGAPKIHLIPTVIDIDNYSQKISPNEDAFVIGWIGSPMTEKYLLSLDKSVLAKLNSEFNIEFHWIGAKDGFELGQNEKFMSWSAEKEVEYIKKFDVGIMPLPDDIFVKGKCGYKLIQYMGCGIPVIGTPVGVNKEIIQEGINGFQAANKVEWYDNLKYLIRNKLDIWKDLGNNGRKLVEEKYSLQSTRVKWLDIIKNG